MKRTIFVVLIALLLCGGISLTTLNAKESEYYYYSVPIEKIYQYRAGYIVVYRKSLNKTARTYIPFDWFENPAGKADLVNLGTGSQWPSLSVYYKEGEFSHVRLYVRRSHTHESWGVIPLTVNLDEYFQDVEEIRLEF